MPLPRTRNSTSPTRGTNLTLGHDGEVALVLLAMEAEEAEEAEVQEEVDLVEVGLGGSGE